MLITSSLDRNTKLFRRMVDENAQVLRKYPTPIFTLVSLGLGSVLHWVLGMDELAHWIWIVTLVIGGIPVIYETVKAMLKGHFATDIVAMLAIIAALAFNDAFPGVIIVLMQTGGRAIEDYAYKRASSSLDQLLARSPRIAHLRRNNAIEDVEVERIRIGNVLVVRPGDIIPVDGSISSGFRAEIDESSLTGESLPKSKNAGDKVYSGTINIGSAFEMNATAKSGESQYAKIVEMVKRAQQEKAPIQRLADRYALWFTPITIAMSILGWATTGNLQTILAVLVVATPCSLIFATPVAIISGINKSARTGIIVKHGAAIEQVRKAEVVIFDKTGTITYGTPEVEKIVCLDSSSEDELLYKAASLEQLSSHPVARMLTAKGYEKFTNLTIPANFREIAGVGVEGLIDGELVSVGSEKIVSHPGAKELIANLDQDIGRNGTDSKMVAFIAVNQTIKGAVLFGDKIRQGVPFMVKDLASLGVTQTVMLTGDSVVNAKRVAEQAGLTTYEADLLPQEKVFAVKALKAKYLGTIMVGDGINDAPALASATVGIAMGARGAAISAEAADIVLLVDDLSKVTESIRIGRRTIEIAKQSILVGLGASVTLMVIASFGVIPPALGALLQEALDVTVILNALRAR
jgi:heavy metal translocating P-type ATPase